MMEIKTSKCLNVARLYPFTNRDAFSLACGFPCRKPIDDITMLNAALTVVDQNPLGSAAGYGSSFPIDRTFTKKNS
jgi:hypothetical protein